MLEALLKRLFPQEKVCLFCNEKHQDLLFEKDGKGICMECMTSLPYTPSDGSFEGSEYVKYIIAPFFYEGAVRRAIRRCKFNGEWAYGDIFGRLAADFLRSYPHLKEFDLITAVPLSKERMNERGFNQSEIPARYMAEQIGIPYVPCVTRIRDTERQSGLAAKERFENVKDAFCSDDTVNGKRILLVDDIYTTGSTMNSCAKAIMEKGASEIVGIVLSKTLQKEFNPYRIYPKK